MSDEKTTENKFEYTYSAPTEDERREIADIRKQYVPQENRVTDMERLRRLNDRVNKPPFMVALLLGIVGILTFGLGLTLALEWQIYLWGAVVAVVGGGIVAAAHPLRKFLLRRNKERYGDEIIEISNKLLNEEDKDR